MKLEKWALVAEVIGAAAIVLSLVFVGIQTKQNTQSQNAAILQEAYRDLRVGGETEPTAIVAKLVSGEDLTGTERQAYISWLTITLRQFENLWLQNEMGILGDEVFDSYATHLIHIFNNPLARTYWKMDPTDPRTPRNVVFVEGFTRYLNQFLLEHPLAAAE